MPRAGIEPATRGFSVLVFRVIIGWKRTDPRRAVSRVCQCGGASAHMVNRSTSRALRPFDDAAWMIPSFALADAFSLDWQPQLCVLPFFMSFDGESWRRPQSHAHHHRGFPPLNPIRATPTRRPKRRPVKSSAFFWKPRLLPPPPFQSARIRSIAVSMSTVKNCSRRRDRRDTDALDRRSTRPFRAPVARIASRVEVLEPCRDQRPSQTARA